MYFTLHTQRLKQVNVFPSFSRPGGFTKVLRGGGVTGTPKILFAKIVSPKVRKSKSETLDIQTHAYLTHQSPRNV